MDCLNQVDIHRAMVPLKERKRRKQSLIIAEKLDKFRVSDFSLRI